MEKIIQQRSYNLKNCEFPDELDNLLARIYSARGVNDLSEITPNLKYLENYHDFKDIFKATKIIADAVIQKQKIIIVGDFDCDGATSTAVALLVLRKLQANVDYIVPSRFKFGYGLTPKLVEEIINLKPDLIITVDNGISCIEGVQFAKENNIKVIITDHHLPKKELPPADAIVNPNQLECNFKSKNIAGVGVIFYTLCALRQELLKQNYLLASEINMANYLDLVALGTIADVVSLDQNNRIFIAQGIARIRQEKCRAGIKALFKVCKKPINDAYTDDIAFYIAPRINAAGRLADMSLSIELLINDNIETATEQAKKLDDLNTDRKNIESKMLEEAIPIAEIEYNKCENNYGKVLYSDSWHQGVIGILAARIKERFHRPTVIFATDSNDSNLIKGSARSIDEFHLEESLKRINDKNKNLLLSFGGHKMAAGLSIHKQDLEKFTVAFNEDIANNIDENKLKPVILTDGELATKQISLNTYTMIKSAAPWGKDFLEPCFEGIFILTNSKIVNNKHLKMRLKSLDGYDEYFEGFIYNIETKNWQNEDKIKIKAVYQLVKTTFKNTDDLKLKISYMQKV